MCRLLCVRSERAFAIADYLQPFAEVARTSREYQGHGWGFAAAADGAWRVHHSLLPIWEEAGTAEGNTDLLLAHARSAFLETGLALENNMPFVSGPYVYIFNGELRGVRIREQGRIGAEKLFNFILRFAGDSMLQALRVGMAQVERRTAYLKAANLLVAEGRRVYVASRFAEDPDYYTLRRKVEGGRVLICSEPFPAAQGWRDLPQGVFEVS